MGSKDAVLQRMAEQQAMRKKGYKFITLELNDMTKNRELEGAMIARMLDCEHNRRFLASMSSYRYWTIMDPDIEKQIIAQAKGITRKAIREMPADDTLTDEELEEKAKAFNEELLRRQSVKADAESEKEALR